jgi:hypothetical protein
MSRSILLAAAVSFAALTGACTTHTARLDTPGGFARLEDQRSWTYRATSPQGVVLAAKNEPNTMGGDLAFWSESIDLTLAKAGYEKRLERPVRTAKGLEGKQTRYVATRNGREHHYWIAVFTPKGRVVVVEAGGDAEPFAKAEATVDRTMTTLVAD